MPPKINKSAKKGSSSKPKSNARANNRALGWIAHVKSVAKSKNISFKDALKVASKSYKKK